MEDIESIERALFCLPFFCDLSVKIKRITAGQSHVCFDVFAGKQRYIAKYIGDRDASQEVGGLKSTSLSGLAPCVSYVDRQWILCHFIRYPSLATLLHQGECDQSYAISSLIKAMVCCHSHQADVQPINFVLLADKKIDNRFFSEYTLTFLTPLFEILIAAIEPSQYVFCHGDLNYSNLLMDVSSGEHALIDYECSGYAEREFDIGMMMAINFISIEVLPNIIAQYQQSMKELTYLINSEKVTRYFFVSLYINALWYFDKYEATGVNAYLVEAKKQQNFLNTQIEGIKKGSI